MQHCLPYYCFVLISLSDCELVVQYCLMHCCFILNFFFTLRISCIALTTSLLFSHMILIFCSYVIQVLLTVGYVISFYVIFKHISQNLIVLQEQLTFIEDEEIPAMHEAIYTKYTMLKYEIFTNFDMVSYTSGLSLS